MIFLLIILLLGLIIIYYKVWLSGNNGFCWCLKIHLLNGYVLVALKLTTNSWQWFLTQSCEVQRWLGYGKEIWIKVAPTIGTQSCKDSLQKHIVKQSSCTNITDDWLLLSNGSCKGLQTLLDSKGFIDGDILEAHYTSHVILT